jgi:hypothetical protein
VSGRFWALCVVPAAVFALASCGMDESDDAKTPTTDTEHDPRFSSCSQARKAGYGPYDESSHEYGWYRDADGDGTVCEDGAVATGSAS